MTTLTPHEHLAALSREASLIGSSAALLGWDQEVLLPEGGRAYRGEQLALLARLAHERMAGSAMSDAIAKAEAVAGDLDPLGDDAVNLRELRRTHERKRLLPVELVEEEARLQSEGQAIWAKARAASDFGQFAPVLERIVDLLRRKAECYGIPEGGEPWDALAEDYEPGCTAAAVDAVFGPLEVRLRELVANLSGSGQSPCDAFNRVAFDRADQEAFVRRMAEGIGFDFNRGRLDTSTHPFCSGTHCGDVRLTTRFHDDNILDALGSTLHECGHGIYEQGLRSDAIGLPVGDSISLGIHESQSRMWENQVGRSEAFWHWATPLAHEILGSRAQSFDATALYGAANVVAPGFIRVEADEATYNLHIIIRFGLERQMLKGELSVRDLPEAWNARYRDLLGVEVQDDAQGCLQDIHWSMTAMGYFPTYTLGNLHAAQLFEAACSAHPGLIDGFSRGEFAPLREWLNANVHAEGKRYGALELTEKLTGQPLSAEPLMRHLEGKLLPLYGLA